VLVSVLALATGSDAVAGPGVEVGGEAEALFGAKGAPVAASVGAGAIRELKDVAAAPAEGEVDSGAGTVTVKVWVWSTVLNSVSKSTSVVVVVCNTPLPVPLGCATTGDTCRDRVCTRVCVIVVV
jgi:hypothetical protein